MAAPQQTSITPAADEARAVATITMAFSNDPVARWAFKDAAQFLTFWPRLVRALGGRAFANGTADTVGDAGGVALWLPPGITPDEERMEAIAAEGVPEAEHDEVFGFMGRAEDFQPEDPYWYLPLIGVDLTKQGRGYGSALLRHGLERCDRDHLPAYLEATSPLNKALYARHGFEETGVIQYGSSPPMWPMLRQPR